MLFVMHIASPNLEGGKEIFGAHNTFWGGCLRYVTMHIVMIAAKMMFVRFWGARHKNWVQLLSGSPGYTHLYSSNDRK